MMPLPNISGSSSQSASQTTAQSSYFMQDSSMVVGGGGSLTKGSMGTPAGQALGMNYLSWLIPGAIAAAVVAGFFLLKRKG